LLAVDNLLTALAPRDEYLAELALDPKRRGEAAQTLGNFQLARSILSSAMTRLLEENERPVVAPPERRRRPELMPGIPLRIKPYIVKKLRENGPMKRSKLANEAEFDGVCKATSVYAGLSELIHQGRVHATKVGWVGLTTIPNPGDDPPVPRYAHRRSPASVRLGKSENWIVQHTPEEPTSKSDIVKLGKGAGWAEATLYHKIRKLIAEGKLKSEGNPKEGEVIWRASQPPNEEASPDLTRPNVT
jgi:hypothetical protein